MRVNPNGMDALRAIDAHQAVISWSFPLLRFEWYGPAGRIGYRLTADPPCTRGMSRVMSWARLVHVLHDEASRAGAVIRYGAAVTDVAETAEQAQAMLADGAMVEGGVVVGADGVGSRVRGRIDPGARPPWRTGTRTVYGFVPRPAFEPPPPEVLQAYVNGAFVALTRDSLTGGCYWFTSLPAARALDSGEGSDREAWRTRLIDEFGLESVPAASAVRDADRILAFDDYALAHWHSDRVVVLGDAAHVAAPGSEQGAAMALEDGVVLAQCVRDSANPAAALATFERQRRARAEEIGRAHV